MNIRLAEKNDAVQVADIHQKEIKKGFLSTLNKKFLAKIYSAIIESEIGFCVVSEKDEKIIGFISGVVNLDKFYFYFLRKYLFQVFFLLFPQIFNFRKIIDIIFYPLKEKDLPKAELLAMVVESQFQGQGVAGQMFKKFVSEMKNKRIDSFKVFVGENLLPAIKFYEKSGFKFVKNTKIHRNCISRVYIYQIK